jgi:hypothetical protein
MATTFTSSLGMKNLAFNAGIHPDVFMGTLTNLVDRFNDNKGDIPQLVTQRNDIGQNPVDLAAFLGYKNVLLYLMTNLGTPVEVVNRSLNVDNEGRNMYHLMCYKGNYESVICALNLERAYLKKILYDNLCKEKKHYRFKAMDIKNGKLVETIFHDQETIAKHEEFNLRVQGLFESYARQIINQLTQILSHQDKQRCNPIHYAAMSKFTKSFKCIEALLNVDIDMVEGYDQFLSYFSSLQMVETSDDRKFDPRKYKNILNEFKHLMSKREYNLIVRDFKSQI